MDIAQTLSLALDSPRDLVARLGGEEFIVLSPQTDTSVAVKVAERCQRLIRKQAIVHAQPPHDQLVTVSIGVGTVTPGAPSNPATASTPRASNCMRPRKTAGTGPRPCRWRFERAGFDRAPDTTGRQASLPLA